MANGLLKLANMHLNRLATLIPLKGVHFSVLANQLAIVDRRFLK